MATNPKTTAMVPPPAANPELPPRVRNGTGELILGERLGRGGEGTVYAVVNRPELAAKVYHQPLSAEKIAKLRVMVGLNSFNLEGLTAWPLELLASLDPPDSPDSPDSPDQTVGFIMPRIAVAQDIHTLYSPRSRKNSFPNADWRFLVRAASNLARAFAVVHETGTVIGDINHSSIVVSNQAIVTLIDCDSFQITNEGASYLCSVGTSLFTPPELQGRNFAEVFRTVNHDCFGLAVLIFQLLMMGRHPYAGRFLGKATGTNGGEDGNDMGIERAIREDRFAYGRQGLARQMEPPPHSLPLAALPPLITQYFELAFAAESRVRPRPTAREWVAALVALERALVACAVNPSHYFFSSEERPDPRLPRRVQDYPLCPWCGIEKNSAVYLFNLTIPDLSVENFDLEKLWPHIQRIEPPGPAPSPPSRARLGKLEPSKAARTAAEQQFTLAPFAALVLVLMAGLVWRLPHWWWIWLIGGMAMVAALLLWRRQSPATHRFAARLKREQQAYRILLENWDKEAGDRRFVQHLTNLQRLRADWLELPQQRAKLYQRAMGERREGQLRLFLESISVRHATVKGIGPARKEMLQSYLIESAYDIRAETLAMVPGIGTEPRRHLLEWRQQQEARFKFDESKPPDAEAMILLDYDLALIRRPIEQKLLSGVTELSQIRNQILKQRQALWSEVSNGLRKLHQAEIDLNEVKG
ncbi:MAG: hypothetical protein QM523_03135 [Candidatus Pacebacteria bacterium]|nr:hypothetical protein [Candidatus Paceibacterota bacterium]